MIHVSYKERQAYHTICVCVCVCACVCVCVCVCVRVPSCSLCFLNFKYIKSLVVSWTYESSTNCLESSF